VNLTKGIKIRAFKKIHPLNQVFSVPIIHISQRIKMSFTNTAISTLTSSIIPSARMGKRIKMGKEAHFQLTHPPPPPKKSKTNSNLTMYIRCAPEISEFEDFEKR
jgi:hypothetical protein